MGFIHALKENQEKCIQITGFHGLSMSVFRMVTMGTCLKVHVYVSDFIASWKEIWFNTNFHRNFIQFMP